MMLETQKFVSTTLANLQQIQVWSPDCLKVMQHGLVKVKPLITASFPLEKVAEAFRVADEDPDQLKVVLTP